MQKSYTDSEIEKMIEELKTFLKSGEKDIIQIRKHFNLQNWNKTQAFIEMATTRILIYETNLKSKVYYGLYE